MKAATDWTCPRCGLIEGRFAVLQSADPARCRRCCEVDAAPELVALANAIVALRSSPMQRDYVPEEIYIRAVACINIAEGFAPPP